MEALRFCWPQITGRRRDLLRPPRPYAHGHDHGEAVALLRKAGALEAAKRLRVLLSLKTKAGYTYIPSTKTDVAIAGRAAQALVAAAERAA